MKTHLTILLLAGALASMLPRTAVALDFFDSSLTVQGTTLDLGDAGRTSDDAAQAITLSGGSKVKKPKKPSP